MFYMRQGDKRDLFNAKRAGNTAFYGNDKGYLVTKVLQVKVSAHRAAWAIFYGEWPNGQIDHMNHNRSDNRISNLRVVDNATNQRNGGRRSDNKSGVCGVIWCADRNKWRARITINGAVKNLGCFSDIDEARAVRKIAEADLGFHPNHGVIRSSHSQPL